MISYKDIHYRVNDFENEYAMREVPNLKVTLIDGNEVKYTFFIDSLKNYHHIYDTQIKKNECHIITALIGKQDLEVLLSKKYEKYIIEAEHIFRSAETGKDEIIYLPAQVYNNLNIDYEIDVEGDPTNWEFIFYNE